MIIDSITLRDVTNEDLKNLAGLFNLKSVEKATLKTIPETMNKREQITIPAAKEPEPVSEEKQKPLTPAKKRHSHQHWQIPFSQAKENTAYARAMYICKKYSLPYPEAIKIWEKDHPKQKTKTPCLVPTATMAPVPEPAKDEIKCPNSTRHLFEPGTKVRQVKPDRGSIKLYQTGEVVTTIGGIAKVRDLAHNYIKVPQDCLVPAEVVMMTENFSNLKRNVEAISNRHEIPFLRSLDCEAENQNNSIMVMPHQGNQ
jgi:hypothetical protein